jgi:hypothetical protein
VLAHEIVHAAGDPRESAGILVEFEVDQRCQKQGKLPPEFNLASLFQQYRDALQSEKFLAAR